MKKMTRAIIFGILAGVLISFLFTVFRMVRGRVVATDKVAYLYPGEYMCNVGNIDVEKSAKWLEVRCHKVDDGKLVFDWAVILENFLIRVVFYSIFSIPVVFYITNRRT